MPADSGATRRRQSEKRRERGRQRVGMGVPTSVCQDERSGATFFRVAEAGGPHDDPPAKGALDSETTQRLRSLTANDSGESAS